MRQLICLTLILILSPLSPAWAHSLWINSFESQAHEAHHTMVSVGWGHALPMGDILTTPKGRIAIEQFELLAPDLTRTPLRRPEFKLSEPELSTPDFDLYAADQATQKVEFKKEGTPGVYQFSLASRPTSYTMYIDTSGKTRIKLMTKDQIKDIQKVLISIKYQAFAKAFVTLGEWSAPKPLGHGLEIIPRSDMSNLRVNDLVAVDVLFHGKPLHSSANSIEFITAQSRVFGQDDGFSLHSTIKEGRAQFRVTTPGQWRIWVAHKDEVFADGPLKELHGKVDYLVHGATFTFDVK